MLNNGVDVIDDEPCYPKCTDGDERHDDTADRTQDYNVRAGIPNDPQNGRNVFQRLQALLPCREEGLIFVFGHAEGLREESAGH